MMNKEEAIDGSQKIVLSEAESKWLELVKKNYLRQTDRLHIITRQGWGYDFEVKIYDKDYKLSYKPYERTGEAIEHVKQRLVDALIYGYVVKKEKLYQVEVPSNIEGRYYALTRNSNGTIILEKYDNTMWKALPSTQLTEDEIREEYNWAWEARLVEKVEE